jgi:hypothetical protein
MNKPAALNILVVEDEAIVAADIGDRDRIRDDHGYWREVQAYLSEHASNSACPDCAAKLGKHAVDVADPSASRSPAGT